MTRLALAAVPLMALRTCMAQPVDTAPLDTGSADSDAGGDSADGDRGGPGGDGGGGDGGDGGEDTDAPPCMGKGTGILEIRNRSWENITLLVSFDCDGQMESKPLYEPLQGGTSMLLELRAGVWDWIAMVENTCTQTTVKIEEDVTTSWEIEGFEGKIQSTKDGWGCG